MTMNDRKNLIFCVTCIAGSLLTLCILIAAGYRG